MTEKKWVIVLAILNIFVLAGLTFWYVKQDREAPVISLQEDFTYEKNMTQEEVLIHVKAVDNKDGDVSHTLVIEKIGPDESGERALITCGARDTSGNMTKYSFYTACDGDVFETEDQPGKGEGTFELAVGEAAILASGDSTEESLEEETSVETEEAEETNPVEEEDESTGSEETAGGEANENSGENTDNEADANEEADNNPDINENDANAENNANNSNANVDNTGAEATPTPEEAARPVMHFSATEVQTSRGSNPAWVTVISQLYDDGDSYETLLGRIKITGNYDNTVPGSYDVTVTTTDSDGNESAPSAIRIIVQ